MAHSLSWGTLDFRLFKQLLGVCVKYVHIVVAQPHLDCRHVSPSTPENYDLPIIDHHSVQVPRSGAIDRIRYDAPVPMVLVVHPEVSKQIP